MDHCADALLDCPNGALDVANMVIGGRNVKLGREQVVAEAVEFIVRMDIRDVKTTAPVQLQDILGLVQQSPLRPVMYDASSAKTNLSGDGVKKKQLSVHRKCPCKESHFGGGPKPSLIRASARE